MKKNSLLEKALLSLACALPIGCSALPTVPSFPPIPPTMSQTYSQSNNNQESNPLKVNAYSKQKFGSEVLGSGLVIGDFPSTSNETGVTLGNDKANVTAWNWAVYNNHGVNSEADHGLTGNLNLNANLTLKGSLEQWTCIDDSHFSIGVLGIKAHNESGFIGIDTLHEINEGGSLYIGFAGKKLTEKLTAKLKTGYSDRFLGGHVPTGFMHLTPGLDIKLGTLGPIELNGNISYQVGLHDCRDSFLYGGLAAEISTHDLLEK